MYFAFKQSYIYILSYKDLPIKKPMPLSGSKDSTDFFSYERKTYSAQVHYMLSAVYVEFRLYE